MKEVFEDISLRCLSLFILYMSIKDDREYSRERFPEVLIFSVCKSTPLHHESVIVYAVKYMLLYLSATEV